MAGTGVVATLNPERRTLNLERAAIRAVGATRTRGRTFDLEDRLPEFSSVVIDVTEKLPKTRAGNHLAGQLLRSGTSPYGNHGEAQAPESADDFIHKMKLCLKELRESRRWLRLIARKNWLLTDAQMSFVLEESEGLVRIFKASVQTAEGNRLRSRRRPVQSTSGKMSR